jgi:uroporphyrinogen III methyltransferase/synthase
MGMTNLKKIVKELILHGRPPETPVCIITWGTYPEQKVLIGTLGDIVEKKEKAGLNPPGIIVIGEVVRLRERLICKNDP